ncbi:MAG: cell wall-binding repeat-containing protein, partial [Coriobacteriia bacterium]|nr:cell wall-binding repeat-containing protein [Coriobacteriia bacterium]
TAGDGIRAAGTGALMISDSIMWNNHGDDVESLVSTTIRYSCTEEGTLSGTGVIHADPVFRDAPSGDVRLRAASPCIDSGDPAVTTGWDYDDIARPQDGDGNGSARPDMGAFEYWLDVQRDAGDDRYATAAAMWGDRMPFTHHAVLATGRNFPDALCAAGLAGLYGAPILLTQPDHLPAEVVSELAARNIYEVFIVGGADVVGESVVSELNAMDIDVVRLAGVDRYETACVVADFIAEKSASGGDSYCLVARGDLFPDALSVAPLAWDRNVPVLLVRPTSVPEVTAKTLEANLYDEAIIAGDVTAVSSGVAGIVDSYVGGVTRLGGDTRYETSAVIAGWALGQGWLDATFFGLATGENFPDALAGGAVCGYEGGPLLLTRSASLNSAARALMLSQQDALREIYLFGGSDVLSNQVMIDCAALMP